MLMMVLAVVLQAAPAAQPKAMAMRTIDRGAQSNVEDARLVTVRTAEEWSTLWRLHAPGQKQPAVDFSREMVAGVFLGSRPTAGYDIEIVGVREAPDGLVVQYRETTPARGAMTAQVLVMPYHIVALPARAGTVRFEKITER